jgi:hypothetical protein
LACRARVSQPEDIKDDAMRIGEDGPGILDFRPQTMSRQLSDVVGEIEEVRYESAHTLLVLFPVQTLVLDAAIHVAINRQNQSSILASFQSQVQIVQSISE